MERGDNAHKPRRTADEMGEAPWHGATVKNKLETARAFHGAQHFLGRTWVKLVPTGCSGSSEGVGGLVEASYEV